MLGRGLRELVVEVLHNRGTANDPDWSVGSGFLIGNGLVLTAAHNVGPGELLIRLRGSEEHPATVRIAGDEDRLDLAVLHVTELAVRTPRLRYGRVDRDQAALVEGCWAVGFPRFKEQRSQFGLQRLSVQVNGEIPTGENLGTELLTLRVTTTPRPLPRTIAGSEWAGMSGAVVFASDVVVGVLTEHHRPEGESALTVVPLTIVESRGDADAWWALLGVDPQQLVRLPPPTARRPAYWATIGQLARGVLLGRDGELADLANFVSGPEGYRWLVADPWAGKTTLAAHFVRNCPPEVDCVGYFLIRRRSDASAERFLQIANAQLAYLLDETPLRLDDPDVFADLWARAMERAEQTGRHLLLVVDGLDEDLGPPMGRPSVAALLPAVVGKNAHVLVTSRRYPEVPNDVDAEHPLRAVSQVELVPSERAAELKQRARQDLDWLLGRSETDTLIAELLGLLASAQGPLSIDDLATLAKSSNGPVRRWYVARLVDREIGRVLEPTGPIDARRYEFAHGTLLEEVQAEFADELDGHRQRIHQWAATYRRNGWPLNRVPRFLLDTYPALLANHAPERLYPLYTDFAYLDTAIGILGVDRVAADLHTMISVPSASQLRRLARLIERQTHELRPPYPATQPGYVCRQLCLEALMAGEEELAEQARQRLTSLPSPQLLPRWTATRISTALLRTLTGHGDQVRAVGVSADGSRAISGGRDRRVLVWDLDRGQQLQSLNGHYGAVYAAAISGDGSRAVSVGGGAALVWDLSRGRQLHQLPERRLYAAAVSGDGTRAVTGGLGSVLVWDLVNGQQLLYLTVHGRPQVIAVAISANGSRAVGGGGDKTVHVWDLATGRLLHRLEGHEWTVQAVAISADGSRAVSGGGDQTVRVWDLVTGRQLHRLTGHNETVQAVAVSADGSRAVSGGWDQTVRVWDLVTGRQLHRLTGHDGTVWSVAVSADGSRAISGGEDRTVRVWDLDEGHQLRNVEGHHGAVYSAAVSADSSRAVSGGEDRTVRVWDLVTSEQLHRLTGHDRSVQSVTISRDGTRAVSAGGGTVMVWDLVSGERVHNLIGHERSVQAVAVSGDGRRAVSGGWDQTVRVWDLASGEQLHRLTGHDKTVLTVAVSGDGSCAISGGGRTVLVWDLRSGKELYRLGHNRTVLAVALSSDGARAVSSSEDHILRVWDLSRGECIAAWSFPKIATTMATATDGMNVAMIVGDDSGAVSLYDVLA